MVFSSTIFLYVFLPIVLILYYILPHITAKNIVLLVSSLLFYAWGEPKYILLMVISILCNYCFGLWIHSCNIQTEKERQRKWILALSVVLNIGLLFYFKYFNLLSSTVELLLHRELDIGHIALPIGISFYTFQCMSYVIDVYREDVSDPDQTIVQKNPLKLALYISMFPQLIAGPIVRYSDIRPYLSNRTHTLEQFCDGIEIFIIGLAKKVILANILGEIADSILHENFAMISSAEAWLGAICYTMQIYYDFCGYSEMAIGLGKIFGFEFLKNFNYPYISRSITEFWRRWHISLSQWFRDYLYIPLGGNRRGNVYINLFIVFLATGIWHGADWSFLLWGIWHGVFILLERIIKKRNIPIPVPSHFAPVLGWLYTMMVVLFGWILFSTTSLVRTINLIQLMFGLQQADFVRYDLSWYLNARTAVVLFAAVICCVPWKPILTSRFKISETFWVHPGYIMIKRVLLLGLLFLSFLLIVNCSYNPFIYFRF